MENGTQMTNEAPLHVFSPTSKENFDIKKEMQTKKQTNKLKKHILKVDKSKRWKEREMILLLESGGYVFFCVCHNYTKGPITPSGSLPFGKRVQ